MNKRAATGNSALRLRDLGRRLTDHKIALTLVVLLLMAGLAVLDTEHVPERRPLYWVSSMDPHYRSERPGKCPHGMDLIPVYAEDASPFGGGSFGGSSFGGSSFGGKPGVVAIAPEVQNQLGVRTLQVERGSLKLTLRSSGRVVADPARVTQLTPRVAAWVDMVFVVSAGETVRRGQPLYALYAPEFVAAQERFLAALRSRDPRRMAAAESELRALFVDDITLAKLTEERVVQRSLVFHAPRDGVVDMLGVSEGAYVKPGRLLMAIGSMDSVWVELTLFESQAGLLKPRQPLRFTTPAHPGLVWEGEVDFIEPDLDAKTRGQRLRARILNPKMLLRPNMLVDALLVLPARKPALLLPRQAVIDLGQQVRAVLDLGDGRFKSVALVLGAGDGEQVEVLEGLTEGDRVVASAHFLIDSESSKTSDFQRLAARDAPAPYPPTWVEATVDEIDLETRRLRLQHAPIEVWKMPAMTMNFQVVDALDIAHLTPGARLRVKIADGTPVFRVLELAPVAAGNPP